MTSIVNNITLRIFINTFKRLLTCYKYQLWFWAIATCSCWKIVVSFFPALSCTSMNLETQRSRHIASPLLRSPSWYLGGIHFLRHALVSLKCSTLEWQAVQYTSDIVERWIRRSLSTKRLVANHASPCLHFLSQLDTTTRTFGNSGNGKLKRKTEMTKMKIVYFLIHTSLKRPPVNKTTRITIYSACQY